MKRMILWTLFVAALIPLTACHWRHHHHNFAAGYGDMNDAPNASARVDSSETGQGT